MAKIIRNIMAGYLVLILAGVIIVFSGVYDVAATSPHWPITTWVMDNARIRSIKQHAAAIRTPVDLDDPARIAMGTSHFAAHCSVCHGAPGVARDDIAQGLYPQPADLARSARVYSSAQLFWILKHGIKMTGMPDWSDHDDDDLWAIVAFVKQLPGMSAQRYGQLVAESMKMGGRHNHRGGGSLDTDHTSGNRPEAPMMDMKGMDMHEGAPASGACEGADHCTH